MFFDELEKRKIIPLVIPGNHDCYTKKAQKEKTFYKYFENKKGKSEIEQKYNLKNDAVEALKLQKNIWYIGLDCSPATHLMSSRGLFSPKAEENLKTLLKKIPEKDFIILASHFPFKFKKSPRKALRRARVLKKILKENPNIKIFLHGHTHHHKIYDMRSNGLPLVLDSGAATNNKTGKWNLLTLNNSSCNIEIYDWKNNFHKWEKTQQNEYML